MKKFSVIMLCILVALSILSCESTDSPTDTGVENSGEIEQVNVVDESDISSEKQEEITVIFPDYEIYTNFPATLDYYEAYLASINKKFEEKEGIKVNIQKVSGRNYEEYSSKREQAMKVEGCAELAFIHIWNSCNDMIEKNLIINVKDSINNMDNLYEGFRADYFIPVGVYYGNLTLKKDMLDKYGIEEPNYDWDSNDFFEIRDKWLNDEELDIMFNIDEYWNTVKLTWNDIDIYNEATQSVDLDNEEVKGYIKMLRNNLLSSNYIYDEDYTAENYYNMFNNIRSEESAQSISIMQEQFDKHFIMSPYEYRRNLLNPLNSNQLFETPNAVVVPDIVEYGKVYGWGFVANKNGKNLDAASKFLNYMLSDEVQLEIYELGVSSDGMAPVSQGIEDEITSLEQANSILEKASMTRKHIISKINEGEFKLTNIGFDEEVFKIQFVKKIVKYIFSKEEYSDEELSQSLQELEKELNLIK